MSTNYLGPNVHGIASPVATVPEGALPPLPPVFMDLFSPVVRKAWADQMQAYARAAVEADRAQFNGFDTAKLPPILVSCVAKLWPGSAGLFWEAAIEKMPARIEHVMSLAAKADRAQQGEPVDLEAVNDMRIAFKVQIDNLIDIAERYAARTREADEEEHDYIMGAINHAREVVGPYSYNGTYRAATKAAAPADAPKWGRVDTVGDMVRNLLTLDQAAPIFTAFHLSVGGERRCKTSNVAISRERVIDGKWIDSSRKDVPYAHVIWAKPDERAASVPDTGIPNAEKGEGKGD